MKQNPQGLTTKSLIESLISLNLVRKEDTARDMPLIKNLVIQLCKITSDGLVNEKILTLKQEFA